MNLAAVFRCTLLSLPLALSLAAAPASAKVSPADAAKLGAELTPIGAEKGPNADGTIPAWTPGQRSGPLNGWPEVPAVLKADKPLYTITGRNMAQYDARLSEGHKYLLRSYDTYKMHVYPSRRLIAFPNEIYAATRANATTCALVGVDNPDNCRLGFPFPIPQSGAEVIWNHKLRYRGEAARRYNNQLIVQADGKYVVTKLVEEAQFYYGSIRNPVPLTRDSGLFIKYLSRTTAPPRLAGTIILVHERAGAGNEGRQAWLYSPGIKRVRRAPTVCCDNPYEGTDGHEFYDQVDMFNGILDRYTWKLVGKREMILPANSWKIAGNTVKYADMARPRHLNPELPRYELQRTWVVEASIRQGTDHRFHKRRFYVTEDGWNIVAVDDYDSRGELFQFQEGHLVWAPNVLTSTTVPEVIYHFNSGRYFLTAMFNEDKPVDGTVKFQESYFEPANMSKLVTK